MTERPRATRWPPPRPYRTVAQPTGPLCPRCETPLPADKIPRSADFDITVCFKCREPVVIDRSGLVDEERKKLELERGVELDAQQKYLKALKLAASRETT